MFPSQVVEECAGVLPAEELRELVVRGWSEQTSHLAWWLALVAELDRREAWDEAGVASCAHWLSWRCAIDARTAREHVRVARRLVELPLLREAFGAARISYSKVRAVTRVATPANEVLLVELAQSVTASQLERTLIAYERSQGGGISLADDAERRAKCGVTTWVDADGLHHTEVVSAPEDGALIDVALRYGRDLRYTETKTPLRGPAGRLEALLWVLRRGLVNAERPGVVEDNRYLILTHVTEASAWMTDDGRVDLGSGMVVHPRTLARLGCGGAILQGMLEGADGRALDLGRRVRTATAKQRQALSALYDTCAFPGCEVSVDFCEFHHLWFWEKGGTSDLDNFRPLCRRHHHLCHEGGWRLVIDHLGSMAALPPGGGARVTAVPPRGRAAVPASALVGRNRANGRSPADGGAALAGAWGGEHMSDFALDVILEGLMASGPARGSPSRN